MSQRTWFDGARARRLALRAVSWLGLLCAMLPYAGQPEARAGESAAPPRVFQAGAATSNITPPLGGPIIGGWSPIPSTHVHDELCARCLVLDNGEKRLALVVCDILGLPRQVCDAAKQAVQEKTGIPSEQVMVSATHTHSAVSPFGPDRMKASPSLNDYQQFLVTRIADGVARAVNNLEPARIGWGTASEPSCVFNRRWLMKPGVPVPNPFGGEDKAVMNPGRNNPNLLKPAGPTDPEVAFVSLQSVDGRPIALLANYSLHYVGGGQRGAISADYFAMFADRIQQLLGADRLDPPFVGIMSNGTSGDINNIDVLGKAQRLAAYGKMRQVAEVVADAVFKAHQKIEFHDWVPLGAAQQELALAVRKPTDQQVAYAKKILAKPEDAKPYHRRERVYAERTLGLLKAPDEIAAVLQALRIGDVGMATIPFEVLVEIGLEIKEKSPFERTFTVSLANGSYGYLPPVGQHALGGYETWLGTNRVEIEAAPKIVESLLEMLDGLK